MSAPDPDQPVTDAADADAARAGTPPTRAVLWFRSVVAHAPDLLAVLDRAGVVKYVSPSAEPLLGYAPDELAGQTLAAFSDLDVAPIAQALGEQPGVPIFIEGGLRHRDGTMRSFEGNVTNLLADPVVQGFVVNARDVTDRREAETARRRSEMALRAIVQASPVAILALDRRGQVHVWNVACEQMFGWTAADIVGGRAPFAAEELDVHGLVEGAFAGDTVTGYEASITRRDGQVVECNLAIAPLRDSNGRPVTAVVIVADVTEQKRAQRAVEASEARFRSLVQHLTDMILVLEDDGTIAYVSPSASAFIGKDVGRAHRFVAAVRPHVAGRCRAPRRDVPEAAGDARYERDDHRAAPARRRRVPVGRDDRREPAARPGRARHRDELPRHHRPRRCRRRDPRQ